MNPLYPDVARRAGHRCEYCRAPEAVFNFPFEVEHVFPVTRGGDDAMENLALSCRACNIHKAARTVATDPETTEEVPIFHPRQHRWIDHFSTKPDSGVVEGITPTGRATVSRLEMNSPTQLEARLQWMRLGLFP